MLRRSRYLRPVVIGAMLISWGGVAAGFSSGHGTVTAAPAHMGFAGDYAVTFRVTNVKTHPATRWIFAPVRRCAAPCADVSFHVRLTTESSWRRTVMHYVWSGSAYTLRRPVQHGFADCRAANGSTAAKGFDVVSTETLRVTRSADDVVASFNGSGRDAYIPNAAGRKAGCAPGAYRFSIEGRRR